jgi:tetratricopeptide (TPR) repeat protein
VRSVELIQDGRIDRAMEELQEGFSLMMELIRLAPPGLHLDVQLGYLYKTLAQAFDASGHPDEANRYLELAYNTFLRIKDDTGAKRNGADIAGALNGMGNVYQGRDELDEAIRYYRLAVDIEPAYAYAWHDLFAATDAVARNGGAIDLGTMREALSRVIESGAGLPGLGEDQIALLRRSLAYWERVSASPPKLAAGPGASAKAARKAALSKSPPRRRRT